MVEISLLASILISTVIALCITLFQYGRSKGKYASILWIGILRFLALFCIVLLLCNPKIETNLIYLEKPTLSLLVDNSSSIRDLGYDSISKLVLEDLAGDKDLEKRFNIEVGVFDSDLKPLDSLNFNSNQTNIAKALDLSSTTNRSNHSAVVLLSDGNQTIGKDYLYALEEDSTVAVLPVVMGDKTAVTDLNIGRINVNKYVYLKNKFPVEVFVNYQSQEDIETKVGIYHGERLLQSRSLKLDKNKSTQLLNFEIQANKIGLQSLRVVVESHPKEKNTINNSRSFAIEVTSQKSRIAILSTLVHPDLGALKKTIESNAFREAELFDPSKDEVKTDGFELFILYQPNEQFKSIIDQLQRQERNYWLISGEDTQWEFLNTLDLGFFKRSEYQKQEVVPLQNTGFNLFGVGEMDFENMPPLIEQMGQLDFISTPEILLFQKIAGVDTMEPLLMVFESDNQKSALLSGEGIWKWRAASYLKTEDNSAFDSYIGNLIQFLSSSSNKKRLVVNDQPFYYENFNNILTAEYYDKNYRLKADAQLNIVLQDSASNSRFEFPMVSKGESYHVNLGSLPPSVYQYTVSVASEDISESGSLQVLPFNLEKQFVNPNIKKLNQLANKYNGKLYFPDQIKELKAHLLSSKLYLPIQKINQKSVSLIHWKWLLALAVLFLSGEWFLRKYNGLI